ncbi:lipopolysaccharide biosynthesis protein [Collinsella ihumii]|uniref:Oligosaccharide flippase family protein n=1 Tax=Collinsella ihumii TaxID=1720204 RepID=A0ABT7XH43_9ACTN|nr:oligosaccharide flippase family protein [Collinsella ihumii]MDN0064725.1 oligosaccharide flippase family protein [Collinsella ihumii]
MDETKRLVKNTGVLAIGGMATKLVSFLLLPLYTSVLSTAEYGTVDYINTIALFLVPVVSVLMDEALFRFLIDCENDAQKRRAVTCSCAAMVVGCSVFAVGAAAAWALFRPGNLAWVVALVVAQALLQMTGAVLRGFGKTPSYALMNFIASAVTIVLNVVFIAVFRWGVVGMLSATVVAQGGAALAFLVRERIWRYVDPKAFDASYAVDLVRYAVPLIPNKVSWTIMNMVDRLIIMNVMGASAAGVYAVSYKFPNVMDTVYGFFYQSWKESSARALGSDGDEVAFYNAVYRALRRFMAAVVLVMTALMPLVYGLLVEGDYGEGMLYVPILLLATYYSNISGFYGGIFTAHRDTGIMGTTTVVSALLCLVLCFLLIPAIGLWGASVATLAATFTVNEYRLAKVRQHANLDRDYKGRAVALLALAAVFALYYAYCYTGAPAALALCIVAALAYSVPANWPIVRRVPAIARSVLKRGK